MGGILLKMKSEAVRLAKIKSNETLRHDFMTLLNNPVWSILSVFIIVEFLQAQEVNGKPLMGSVAGSMLEGGMITGEALAALSKSGVLDSLLPMLLARV